MNKSGLLSKMHSELGEKVQYKMNLSGTELHLNQSLGKKIRLTYSGKIFCSHCQKKIKKSYSQGFCYPCSLKLASCDLCILRPETCHYHLGTCREPEWGLKHCFQPHIVYLANTSGLKVGITRKSQCPYRWIDQGASTALPILEVQDRLTSGLIEVSLKKYFKDKTDWRAMLKGESLDLDLVEKKEHIMMSLSSEFKTLNFQKSPDNVIRISYPVLKYPSKVTSLGLDKTNLIEGILWGIKGQYLIFDCGVFNVRAHSGYDISWEESDEPVTT